MSRHFRTRVALTLTLTISLTGIVHADVPLFERLAHVTSALAESPLEAQLLLTRGALFRELGEFDRARRDLGMAARLRPESAPLAQEQARIELAVGRPRIALEYARRALRLDPDDPRSLQLVADCAAELGDYEEAAEALDRCLDLAPDPQPEDYLERADYQAKAGVSSERILAGLELGIQRIGPAVPLVRVANAKRALLGASSNRSTPESTLPVRRNVGAFTTIAGPVRVGSRAAQDRTVRLVRGPYLQSGTPHELILRWRTDVPADARVSYATSLDGPWQESRVAAVTKEHEVLITQLQSDTKYFYSIAFTAPGGDPQVLAGGDNSFFFRTAPEVGTPKPTRVWVVGDSGTANKNARAVRDAFVKFSGGVAPDFWMMLGDNAYNSGTDVEYQRSVFETYPTQLATSVLWPTRGNHDVLHAGPNNDYYDIFTLPKVGEAGGLPSGTEAYYSFDYANAHFVCLDSEGTTRSPGSAMLVWLAEDLAATTLPWTVAYWHHPPYTKGSHNSDDVGDSERRLVDMREFILPVLEEGGVDLVLCGHSHSYERSMLIHGHYGFSATFADSMKIDAGDGHEGGDGAYQKAWGGETVDPGTVYAVAGSSGKISGGSLDHPVMITSLNVLGSMVLDVEGLRMDVTFLDSKGAARDQFTLEKTEPRKRSSSKP